MKTIDRWTAATPKERKIVVGIAAGLLVAGGMNVLGAEEQATGPGPVALAAAQERADQIGTEALETNGVSGWQELCPISSGGWVCEMGDFRADRVGDLYITIHGDYRDWSTTAMGEPAINTVFATVGASHPELDGVVAEDGVGVVIDQKSRNGFPALGR